MHGGRERAAIRRTSFAYQIHDGRLPVGVLLQDCRLARLRVRHHLPPVVQYEFLRDSVCRQLQWLAGVVALLNAQNRERKQQGEFVRRGEQTLVQQSLYINHEPDLFVGRRRHLAAHFQYGMFRNDCQRRFGGRRRLVGRIGQGGASERYDGRYMADDILEALTRFYKEAKIYSHEFACPNQRRCEDYAKKAISTEMGDWEKGAKTIRDKEGGLGDSGRVIRKLRESLLRHGRFTEARSAYVGNLYCDNAPGFRLLFLSLDPGGDDISDNTTAALFPADFPGFRPGPDTASQRTPEAVQKRVMEDAKKDGVKKSWTHWHGTHRLAAHILREASPSDSCIDVCSKVCTMLDQDDPKASQQLAEVTPYFANANVVKCSIGRLRNAQAPPGMYRTCRDYLRSELAILKPDIVVTQGQDAEDALRRCVLELDGISACGGRCNPKCSDRCKLVLLCGRRALWIQTYHPAGRIPKGAKQRPFDTEGGPSWNCYTAAAKAFVNGSPPESDKGVHSA